MRQKISNFFLNHGPGSIALVLLTFLLLAGSLAHGATVKFGEHTLESSNFSTGLWLTAWDNQIFKPDGTIRLVDGTTRPVWKEKFFIATSQAWVKLKVDPYGTSPLREVYQARFQVAVKTCSVTSGRDDDCSVSSKILEVDYDPAEGTRYRDNDVHLVRDVQYLSVVIEEFVVTNSSGDVITDSRVLRHFSVDPKVQEERYYRIPNPADSPIPEVPVRDSDQGEIRLRWQPVIWAEYYELEWTHINDYQYPGTAVWRHSETLTYDFRFESTRVPVTDTQYALPLIFERGYVVWRVRAVGFTGEDFQQPVEGPWALNPQDSGIVADVVGGGRITIREGHSPYDVNGGTARNWQHVAAFAEGGKRKDLVQYLDGSLRSRQTVTKLNTDDTLIVSENIYDHSGRPAIAMLPSPIPREAGRSTAIAFQPDFNLNLAGYPYSFRDFEVQGDADPTCERPLAQALQTTLNGAGRYFSPNNPYIRDHQAYVPDARGFPFAQRTYTPDNTGRVRRQGGIGPVHQIGCGHEQQYFYGVPDQSELDRLFGNDAGYAQHYKRHLLIDPDGQASFEYLDPAGRVIATALAGDAPSALLPLENQTSFHTNFDLLEQGNQRLSDEPTLRSSKTILVAKAGQFDFIYRMDPPDVTDETCSRTEVCLDCVYDLEIQLINQDGHLVRVRTNEDEVLETITRTIGGQSALLNCRNRDGTPVNMAFSANLVPGSYRVIKRLTVNEDAADRYVEEYMKHNGCLPQIREQLKRKLQPHFDPSQCESPCIQCERVKVAPPDVSLNVDPPLEVEAFSEVLVEQRRNTGVACTNNCQLDPSIKPCETAYQAILADVSPGGQYAGYLVPEHPEDFTVEQVFDPNALPPLSVLNSPDSDGANRNKLPLRSADWKHPVGGYRNADGTPSHIIIPEGDEALCEEESEGTEAGYCRPENLNRVKDFIRFWKPSWAEALAVFHPEYGYYQWCRRNESLVAFDHQLQAINTLGQAQLKDLSALPDGDPLVAQADLSASERSRLRVKLGQIETNCGKTFGLTQLVHLIVGCNNPNFSEEEARECAQSRRNAAIAAGLPGYGQDPAMADHEWRMLRDLYRSRRQVVIEEQRNAWLARTGHYFTNDCIGSEDRACARPMNQEAYRKKTKRFPGHQDALDLLPSDSCSLNPQITKRKIYKRCGKCPQQLDLEVFLSSVALEHKLAQDFDFPLYPVIPTKELLSGFPDPLSPTYHWDASEEGQRLSVQIRTNTQEQCQIQLHKLSSTVAWDDLQWIGWVTPTTTPTALEPIPERNFTAKGVLADGQTIPLEGSISCLNMSTCDFPRSCEPAKEIAAEVERLANFLFTEDRFQANTEIVLHESTPPFSVLGEKLGRFGYGPNWYWKFLHWGIPDGLKSDHQSFVGNIKSGPGGVEFSNSCQLTFTILTPGYYFGDLKFSVTGVREFYQDAETNTRCATPEIHLDAVVNEPNSQQHGETVVIRMISACHKFGQCCVSPSCLANQQVGVGEGGRSPGQLLEGLVIRRPGGDSFITPAENNPVLPPPTLTNLSGCDTCCFTPLPGVPYTNPCADQLEDRYEYTLEREYEEALGKLRKDIRHKYFEKCLDAIEIFEANFEEKIYHFTLFYYDQAGNLIQTVPPKGVNLLTPEQIRAVQTYRDYPGEDPRPDPVYPIHDMETTYRHNTLNEVIETTTPDAVNEAGTRQPTVVFYDRLGRPVASQDGRQKQEGRYYSYIDYDPLGRVKESGELRAMDPLSETTARDEVALVPWRRNSTPTEFTRTHYDTSLSETVNDYFDGGQQNLRNRVASMTRNRVEEEGTYRHATHFSYDIHGNVKTVVQENPRMPTEHQIKTIAYEYDVISGNLNQRIYQPDKPDQFIHRYTYDADNRMVAVETSRNGLLWDRDASYQFYDHGPLARMELGEEQVQGLDYAYTIKGQLKGVNSDTLRTERDMGKDGDPRRVVAADAVGYSLGYHEDDYRPIRVLPETDHFVAQVDGTDFGAQSLFDGSITRLVTANTAFMDTQFIQGTAYRYDQVSRLRAMDVFRNINAPLNTWNEASPVPDYQTRLTYDPNGNIQTLSRNGASPNRIDDLEYKYQGQTNRLSHVFDTAGTSGNDLDTQPENNYAYDISGRLTQDRAAGITSIVWNAKNKVETVTKEDSNIMFAYDAAGRRVMKKAGDQTLWYVLDATGQIMATYSQQDGDDIRWESSPIYGHQRLGVYQPHQGATPDSSNSLTHYRSDVRYELTNHLGSILALISDRKLPPPSGPREEGPLYLADVMQARDYYPFGMVQPGRKAGSSGYRFGFQGMEQDNQVKGNSNSYTTEFRLYDPRIGRWLSVDPLLANYPSVSPYVALGNSPLHFRDPLGLQPPSITPRSDRNPRPTPPAPAGQTERRREGEMAAGGTITLGVEAASTSSLATFAAVAFALAILGTTDNDVRELVFGSQPTQRSAAIRCIEYGDASACTDAGLASPHPTPTHSYPTSLIEGDLEGNGSGNDGDANEDENDDDWPDTDIDSPRETSRPLRRPIDPREAAERDARQISEPLRQEARRRRLEGGRHGGWGNEASRRINELANAREAAGDLPEYVDKLRSIGRTLENNAQHRGGVLGGMGPRSR